MKMDISSTTSISASLTAVCVCANAFNLNEKNNVIYLRLSHMIDRKIGRS